MKRELYLYLILGFFISALAIIQFSNSNFKSEGTKVDNVQTINTLKQLMIEVESNIYLVEGDESNIIVEGPNNLLDKIMTNDHGGCISIISSNANILTSMMNSFLGKEKMINIYITLPELDDYIINNNLKLHSVKYQTDDLIGMSLRKGERIVIESKEINGCT